MQLEKRETRERLLVFALLFIGALGLLDAAYLTARHYWGKSLVCTVLEGCTAVTTSSYATVLGVPVALVGFLYYLVVVALLYFILGGRRRLIVAVAYLTGAGFLVSLYLTYLQAFVLNAFCLYCLLSALSTTLLFLGSASLTIRERSLSLRRYVKKN